MLTFENSTKELSEAAIDTAIISVGSTEQCGPSLPFHIDTLVASYFARAWGEALNAYVLPTLPFNTSEEHSAFRGTITVRPATIMLMLEEVVGVLREQGFRKQVLTVGHGGSLWMPAFIKQINHQFKDIVLVSAHQGGDDLWVQALEHSGFGGRSELHGGAQSRALALFLAPGSVSDGAYGREIPEAMMEYADYVGWEKITPDGSWGRYGDGDADTATAEAGRRLLEYFTEHQARRLVKHMEEACRIKGIAV
jgi:creatinine amidohydrolase